MQKTIGDLFELPRSSNSWKECILESSVMVSVSKREIAHLLPLDIHLKRPQKYLLRVPVYVIASTI